ncbi:hypothetical protein [Candidatus Poriferisodalis sp.]|uniref:hypothetical protein n=1 Tax=Candidatus Poriferisodalis sp. TaxID=3101277 RepID=UPI003B02A7AC
METATRNFGQLDAGSLLVDAAATMTRWDALVGLGVGARQSAQTFSAVESTLGRLDHSHSLSAIGSWRSDLGRMSNSTLGLDAHLLGRPGVHVEHILSKLNALARAGVVTRYRVDPTDLVDSEHLAVLIANDWYLPFEATDAEIRAVVEQFEHDKAGANERMCRLIRDHLDRIETDIVQQSPHRESILREAFAAHREGRFNLSIPAILPQIDGIWHERCGHNLFGSDIRKVVAAAQDPQVKGGIIARLLQSLTNPEWKLRQPRRKRAAGFVALNRHQVLHGEVTDYGTEENSLKAIALLHFSSFVLPSPAD